MQLLFNSGPPISFSVRSRAADNAIVVEVAGEVDLNSLDDLGRALLLDKNGVTRVVVDLTTVTFIDSSGLRELVSSKQELETRAVSLRVVVPRTGHLRRIFELTGLIEPLDVVATVDEALGD